MPRRETGTGWAPRCHCKERGAGAPSTAAPWGAPEGTEPFSQQEGTGVAQQGLARAGVGMQRGGDEGWGAALMGMKAEGRGGDGDEDRERQGWWG